MINILTYIFFLPLVWIIPSVSRDISKEIKLQVSLFKVSGKLDLLSRIFSLILFSGTMLLIFERIIPTDSEITDVVISIFAFTTVFLLLFIGATDLLHKEIPFVALIALLVLAIAVNLITILFASNGEFLLTAEHYIHPTYNFMTGILFTSIFWSIWKITKGHGMGEGDIYLVAALALFLGPAKMITGFYISILIAIVVGLSYSLYKGQYKRLQIPFTPFLIAGAIISFLLEATIFSLFIY